MKKYVTNIAKIKSGFNNEISHYNMLNFVGNTLGMNFEKIHGKSKLIIEISDIKPRRSKPNQKDKNGQPAKQEKDIIVYFEIKNQEIEKYTFQVLESKKVIFEKVFLSKNANEKELTKDRKKFIIGEHKIVWNCSSNGIFETKDAKRKLKFKITAVGNEKQLGQGEKEIELKSYLEQNTKNYNSTEFNKERVVMWLMKDYTPKRELLPNNKTAPTIVYAGAKMIRLKPNKESENTPCLFWWNSAYRIQEFPEELLSESNEIKSEHTGEVFQNEIVHLLSRASPFLGRNNQIDLLIKGIEDYRNGKADPTQNSRRERYSVVNDDKPKTIDRYIKMISTIYNPVNEDGDKWFDSILVIPLSVDWFKSDSNLESRYNEKWVKSKDGFLNNLSGDESNSSGAFSYSEDELKAIKEELISLKIFIQDKEIKESPETLWINDITETKLETIKRVVFIHNGTWHYSNEQIFAEGIGLVHTLVDFKFPALFVVLLHEFSQGDSYFYKNFQADPHIAPEATQESWMTISQLPYTISNIDKAEFIDNLYISDIGISVVSFSTYLNT